MGSFRFPRLIIEAECSSLSANVCFDLRLSQHFCPWWDAAQRQIFACALTRAIKWIHVRPPFVSFEAAGFATRPLTQHVLVCVCFVLFSFNSVVQVPH